MEILSPDFQSIFQASPALFLILAPTLEIIAASDTYLAATMITREMAIGNNVMDLFPVNPDIDSSADSLTSVYDSFHQVLKTKKPHVMPAIRYDIMRPDGTYEIRYWTPVNTPVLGPNGTVIYIINCVEDVTPQLGLKHQQIERLSHLDMMLQQLHGALTARTRAAQHDAR